MNPVARCCLLCLLVALVTLPGVAGAGTRDEARVHYELGVKAYDQGRYEESAREFETSYAMFPSNLTLYSLGGAYAKLGRCLQAIKRYNEYLEKGQAKITTERREEVQRAIEALRQRIGTLEIAVRPEAAKAELDGEPIALKEGAFSREVDPGRHEVQVALDGYETYSRTITVGKGQRLALEIALKKHAKASSRPVKKDEVQRPTPGYVWVAGGVTAVAWLAAAVVGGVYCYQRDRVEEGNPDTKDHYDLAKSLDTASRVLFPVAGAGTAITAFLYFTRPEKKPEPRTGHAVVSPWFAPHAGGLSIGGTL